MFKLSGRHGSVIFRRNISCPDFPDGYFARFESIGKYRIGFAGSRINTRGTMVRQGTIGQVERDYVKPVIVGVG